MNKSENLNELATALSKLQGKLTDTYKDKSGYGYKYSTLSSVLEIARPLLAENNLAVTQLCSTTANAIGDFTASVLVETVLMHSSGQWLSTLLELPVSPMKAMTAAQAAGSVITYARRYSLASLLGIGQVDDDGLQEQKPQVAKAAVTEYDHKELLSMLEKVPQLPTEIKRWLSHYKVSKLSELTPSQADAIVKMLKEKQTGVTKNV